MSDRLQQLAIFVRTVETGSFSRVAREFGLSQPSVSRTVAGLEDRLGVKLLTRTTRRLSLTNAGEALLTRAREALAGVDEAENAARAADRLTGVLRVALPATYGAKQIVPLLPTFLERHPRLSIDLLMSDRFENLVAEGADLAVRLGNQPESSFVARKIATARRLFVASPIYLARRGTPKTLADLGQHHLIGGPIDGGEQKWRAVRHGIAEVQPVDPRVRARTGTGAVACAVAGLGVAVVSTWMCAEELAAGALAEVLGDWSIAPISAFVVFPAGRRPTQKARAFSSYLEQAMATSGPGYRQPT